MLWHYESDTDVKLFGAERLKGPCVRVKMEVMEIILMRSSVSYTPRYIINGSE